MDLWGHIGNPVRFGFPCHVDVSEKCRHLAPDGLWADRHRGRERDRDRDRDRGDPQHGT